MTFGAYFTQYDLRFLYCTLEYYYYYCKHCANVVNSPKFYRLVFYPFILYIYIQIKYKFVLPCTFHSRYFALSYGSFHSRYFALPYGSFYSKYLRCRALFIPDICVAVYFLLEIFALPRTFIPDIHDKWYCEEPLYAEFFTLFDFAPHEQRCHKIYYNLQNFS